jgi:RimJ/RimL family protein N-acetyltransferase
MSAPIPVLTTPRLRLRPFTAADADRVALLAGVPEVARMTANIPYPYPDGLAEAWIAGHPEAAAAGRVLTWAITRADEAAATGALIGSITLVPEAQHQRAAIGYWLGVPYWRHGYASEAAHRVLVYGFAERGLRRIQATVFPRNPASARVLEKIGMCKEGVLHSYLLRDGRSEDVALYAVLREEWVGLGAQDTPELRDSAECMGNCFLD